MSPWFWGSFFFIIVGLILTWYTSIRALNSSFSKNEEHGLFWAGTVCLTIGIVTMLVIVFSYARDNTRLMQENRNLNIQLYDLKQQLGQCGKGGSSGAPSGPGFFSNAWSGFKGFFKRNAGTPDAGNVK